MTEAPEETINLNKETRKVKVLLDTSPQVAAKDEKIAELNQKIGEQENLIKAMLVRDKADFIERIEPKKVPEKGETANLLNEPSYQEEHVFQNVDFANSDIPPEWVKGKTAAEAIALAEEIAKSGNKEYQRIMGRLTKKMLHSNKALNIEFTGSSIDFVKSPLPISEFDSDEVRDRKVAYNERLRNNRCSWRNLNED